MSKEFAFTSPLGNGLLNVLKTDIYIESPDGRSIKIIGIWDTGATNSSITHKVIEALNLAPSGIVNIATANGVHQGFTYIVNIGLPNNVLITGLNVTDAILGDDCDALIGMDIIVHGDFAISNYNGQTIMSFRTPPKEHIDFTSKNSN